MPDEAPKPGETPEGAAVFPLIPAELGVHPLLLAALHAYVFLEGSDAKVLNPAVAEEAMNYLVTYLQRLSGPDLRRVREDMQTLAGFAKADKWPKQQVRFLQDFLNENGIGEGGA
jgi:cytochrome c1